VTGDERDGNVVSLASALPSTLAQQVEALTRPANKIYAGFPALGDEPSYHPDAQKWLQQKQAILARPASVKDCHDWLIIVACGVNGVTESDFKSREMAVWDRCDDLPALVWCKATRRTIFDRTPFLPSPGEVRAVLDGYLDQFKREIAALWRIAREPKPGPPREIRWRALPRYQHPPSTPEWTKSRHVPGLGTGGDGVPSLGESVRRVTEQLAARQKEKLAGTKPADPEAAG
jgi:hypothetical protein